MKKFLYIIVFAMLIMLPSLVTAATLTQLTFGEFHHFEPQFSPTQDVIIYAGGNLYTIPVSGGIPTSVLETGVSNYAPCYFPDGLRIVYNSQGPNELFVYDGVSTTSQITFNGGRNDDPSVSPDGEWVYFVRDKFGNSTIWRIHPDGSGQQVVINGPGRSNSPSLSRDGTTLYFSTNTTGTFQIWQANPDGTNPIQVTPDDGYNRYYPVQSPSAPLLAYTGEAGGTPPSNKWGVYLCALNGQNDMALTSGTLQSYIRPSWSRFGDKIAFQGVIGGEYQVFVLSNFELPVSTHSSTWGHLKSLYR